MVAHCIMFVKASRLMGKKRRLLTGKVSGKELEIPLFKQGSHHNLKGHERLTCDSCHAAWAPQCYGCHIGFDANQKQWDHLLDRKTPGRWIESRWAVESGLPALGVDEQGRITTFVPGMNLILEKPSQRKLSGINSSLLCLNTPPDLRQEAAGVVIGMTRHWESLISM